MLFLEDAVERFGGEDLFVIFGLPPLDVQRALLPGIGKELVDANGRNHPVETFLSHLDAPELVGLK